jgi:Mg-chelatase subunit ChlI
MGDIYIRFLATTSRLHDVNRGLLFVENIDKLEPEIAGVLAQTLRERSYTLEKDGKTMTFPCKFSLIGTLSKEGAEVEEELAEQVTLFVPAGLPKDSLAYRTKYIQYRKDYDADPSNFGARLDRTRREWMFEYLQARKLMPGIGIPNILEKALDHYSTELSTDECFPDKLKGLSKVIAAKNLSAEVTEKDASEAVDLIRCQERILPEGEIQLPPVLQPFVGIAQAVAEAEVLKDKLLLLLISMEEMGGAVIRGFHPDAVRSALRYLQEMEFTIQVVKGCRYSCDPARPEELCPECRLKYEYDRLEAESLRLPVVFLPQNVDVEGLKGGVFVNYIVKPNLLTRAHRGILFIENVDNLEPEVETVLASILTTGRNAIERNGIVVERPCRILLVATKEDEDAELHPLISDRLRVLIEATPEDRTLIRLKALANLVEFGSKPELFSSKILEGKEKATGDVMAGQELLAEIEITDAQLDLIARMCAEFDVEGNNTEFRIESVAKSLVAMKNERRVNDGDIVNAAQMVIPLTASSRAETREEMAEGIKKMVLQHA